MTSKTSFINKGIIKHNLKLYWWIAALMFAVLFIATILRIALTDVEYYIERVTKFPDRFGQLITSDAGMLILVPTASVLIAVCVFRFLQSSKYATLLHSMPPKRTALFTSSYISGIILFTLPVIASALILLAMSLFTDFGLLFSCMHVLKWCGQFLLYGLAFYSFSVFVGMFTGQSVSQFIFTYIVLALPLGAAGLISALFDGWLYAYTSTALNPVMNTLIDILPFHYVLAADGKAQDIELWQFLLMGGYILFSYIISVLTYKKRNIETSGDIVVFKFVRPIFLFGVSVFASLSGTALIKAIQGAEHVSVIALIIFGLIGYTIAKMLLIKSFKIFKYYKEAILLCVALVLFYLAVTFNVLGFGTKTPDIEKVEKAYLGTYVDSTWLYGEVPTYFGSGSQSAAFCEIENIESIIELQKNAVDGKYLNAKKEDFYSANTPEDVRNAYNFFTISYKIKNGQTKYYEYLIAREDALEILSTSEAKDYMFPYVRNKEYEIDSLRISCNRYIDGRQEEVNLGKKVDIEKFLDYFKKDIDALSYADLFEYQEEFSINIDIQLNMGKDSEGHAFLGINDLYAHTVSYLEENYPGFMESVKIAGKEWKKSREMEVELLKDASGEATMVYELD